MLIFSIAILTNNLNEDQQKTLDQRCPTWCPRAFFCPPSLFQMPTRFFSNISNTNYHIKHNLLYTIVHRKGLSLPGFIFLTTLLARHHFLTKIFARLRKRLGTAALDEKNYYSECLSNYGL
jgi:hypothetical protein